MKKVLNQDNTELIIKIHQQLIVLEKKIDMAIAGATPRPFQATQYSNPAQAFGHSHHHGAARRDRDRRERILHKAICADCNKGCEVPFKPSQDRPVYCKECFAKRKSSGTSTVNNDNRPRDAAGVQERAPDKHHRGAVRRFGEMKMASSKKRKRSKG